MIFTIRCSVRICESRTWWGVLSYLSLRAMAICLLWWYIDHSLLIMSCCLLHRYFQSLYYAKSTHKALFPRWFPLLLLLLFRLAPSSSPPYQIMREELICPTCMDRWYPLILSVIVCPFASVDCFWTYRLNSRQESKTRCPPPHDAAFVE